MSSTNTWDFTFLEIAIFRFLNPLILGILMPFQSNQLHLQAQSLGSMRLPLNDAARKKWTISSYNDGNHYLACILSVQ